MTTQQDQRLTELSREGFTAKCARYFNAFVPLDDVSDREAQAIVRRGDLLAALEGVQQAKSVGAIRRATVLS